MDIVRNKNNGNARISMDIIDERIKSLLTEDIDPTRRLIEKEYIGSAQECEDDECALELATRECPYTGMPESAHTEAPETSLDSAPIRTRVYPHEINNREGESPIDSDSLGDVADTVGVSCDDACCRSIDTHEDT